MAQEAGRADKRGQGLGVLGLFFLLPCLLAGCAATTSVVRQPPEIGADLRCPVCGGHPGEQSRWQCQILMGDGRQIGFDSGKDMFSYLLLMSRYNYAKNQGVGKGLAAVWVRDYLSGSWLDGQTAWYVAGSQVRSPAGREIIPFSDRLGAENFSQVNGGGVVAYASVDSALLKELRE